MRNKFDEQLDTLNNTLISMGAMCENAIACAVKAMLTGDIILAQNAIRAEKDIDRMERDIESLCLKLLLQQQPVAKDLRLISSALKMVTDMERIGDQAADIAEIVCVASLTEYRNNKHISQMAECVISMVTESIDAFVRRDISAAETVIVRDDVVDELFSKIKTDLISLVAADTNSGEAALDILMIAKYLERIGDHAVNVAEWVEFSITGKHVDD